MDSIPFLHANRIFTILFTDDLAFAEVRGILDYLLEENAFSSEVQLTKLEYVVDLEDASFHVWVSEMDVLIERG
jgi:hypothetical protein